MKAGSGDRFFRAMVLMGSSMALGCGGSTSSNSGAPDGAGGAGGAGGSGGSGPGPGPGTTGGSLIVPTSPPDVGSVDPGPFPCVPAQWDCSSTPPVCSEALDGWALPEECACSDTRPKSAADCASGQSFVCREATARWDGARYTESVPFQCYCVEHNSDCRVECAGSEADWTPFCSQVEGLVGEGGAAGAPVVETLCGCAAVVLK